MFSESICEGPECLLGSPETLLEPIKKERIKKGKKVILLAGPTGVGKTELSLHLAKAIGGEVISADSVQTYKGADIGTAKVSKEERLEVPHHLIDIFPVTEQINVYDYYLLAVRAIDEILSRGNVPIVVGGAGFYFKTLMEGPPQAPPGDPEVREKLEHEAEQYGIESLYERLQEVDPEYAAKITFRDRQKIIRGLEIVLLTKKRVSEFQKKAKPSPYLFRPWFLFRPREILYARTEKRCDEMLAEGLIEETEALVKRGMEQNRSLAMAIGYRQVLEYLRSPQTEEDFKNFVMAFKKATRQYVKRQFTWFRKEEVFRWLNLELFSTSKALERIIEDYLIH